MAKLIAIHKRPADPQHYEAYYRETHLPLALALPGLRRYELSTGPVHREAGGLDVLFIATLHFDDAAGAHAALASPQGHAAMEDVPKFAQDGNVEIQIYEDEVLL